MLGVVRRTETDSIPCGSHFCVLIIDCDPGYNVVERPTQFYILHLVQKHFVFASTSRMSTFLLDDILDAGLETGFEGSFDGSFDGSPGSLSLLDEDLTLPTRKVCTSSTDDEGPDSKRPRKGGLECDRNPGRNAQIARLNRERKKAYMSQLEDKVKSLEAKLLSSKQENANCLQQLLSANQSIEYLQSIIRNETSLGALLATLSPLVSFPPSSHKGDVIPLTINLHLKSS
jgi:hypothetical protein